MDFQALLAAFQAAHHSGDRAAAQEAIKHAEVETLDPQPGEARRFRFKGQPPEAINVHYLPAPAPPPSFPDDLAWIPNAQIAIGDFGAGLTVFWFGVDPDATIEAIMDAAKAAGWAEPPGPAFATASGIVPRYLEKGSLRRQLIGVGTAPGGMVQLLQQPVHER